jgi:hypothetical protein
MNYPNIIPPHIPYYYEQEEEEEYYEYEEEEDIDEDKVASPIPASLTSIVIVH